MALLAARGHGGTGLGGIEAGDDRLTMRRIGTRQHQVAPEAMTHHKAWISRERIVDQAHGIIVIF
jgi:hypothetical protein